jgi:hypothetical protein
LLKLVFNFFNFCVTLFPRIWWGVESIELTYGKDRMIGFWETLRQNCTFLKTRYLIDHPRGHRLLRTLFRGVSEVWNILMWLLVVQRLEFVKMFRDL